MTCDLSFFLYFSPQNCHSSTLLPKIRCPFEGWGRAGCLTPHTSLSSNACSPFSAFLAVGPLPRAVIWATRKSTTAHIISVRISIIRGNFLWQNPNFPCTWSEQHPSRWGNACLFSKKTLDIKSSEIAGLDLEVGPWPADATYVSIYTSLTDNLFYQVH